MNPYQVLGAPPDADVETLRVFYRQLVRVHHPDRAPDEAARALATARMVAINEAWAIVSNPARRADFDLRARAEQWENAQRQARQNFPVRPREQADSYARRQTLERQALERERRHASSHRAGRVAKKRGESRAERRLRREAQRANPSARRQLVEAARLFVQEGRAGEAIAICHEVLRVDGRNVPARELLGEFYLQLGRQDRALPLWEQALILQPDNAPLRRKLNALRPHQARPYTPQPHIPRPQESRAEPLQPAPARAGFWHRLRARWNGKD